MHALYLHAKLALYARQLYMSEVTRGIAFVLIADLVVSLMLKRIERHRRRFARQLTEKRDTLYARARA